MERPTQVQAVVAVVALVALEVMAVKELLFLKRQVVTQQRQRLVHLREQKQADLHIMSGLVQEV
jgi:hypothetical protein